MHTLDDPESFVKDMPQSLLSAQTRVNAAEILPGNGISQTSRAAICTPTPGVKPSLCGTPAVSVWTVTQPFYTQCPHL